MMAGPDEIGAGRPSGSPSKKGATARAGILLILDRPSRWDLEEDFGLIGPFYKQHAPNGAVKSWVVS